LVGKALRLVGSRGPNGGAIPRAFSLIAACLDRLKPLVTRRVGYDQIIDVLTESDYLREGKVVFRPRICENLLRNGQ
jgi:threonine dehydrogenase-like Zn-dependent dehydrogenase